MFSSERTASLISRHSPSSTRPATSLSNFCDGVLPRERMGSEARVVLNLVLDHFPVLQPDDDLGGHFLGIFVRVFMVRPDRNLLQQSLHIGLDDAVGFELRRHHVAVEEGHRKQVRQAVIRLFLGPDDFVHAVETAAGEVVAELEHVCLNRDHLAGIEFVLPGEFDHAMDRGLRVDHGVVLFDGALHDALVSLFVPVDVDRHAAAGCRCRWGPRSLAAAPPRRGGPGTTCSWRPAPTAPRRGPSTATAASPERRRRTHRWPRPSRWRSRSAARSDRAVARRPRRARRPVAWCGRTRCVMKLRVIDKAGLDACRPAPPRASGRGRCRPHTRRRSARARNCPPCGRFRSGRGSCP